MALNEQTKPPIAKSKRESSSYGILLDTYENEFEVPDFTVKQIRSAIPAHCFERLALRSFAYTARDVLCYWHQLSTYFTLHHARQYSLNHTSFHFMDRIRLLPSSLRDRSLGDSSRVRPSVFFDIQDTQ